MTAGTTSHGDVEDMELSDTSLEITALIAVHVTSQTLYTEITNAVHVTSLPGSWYVCLHFANAHEEHGAVSSTDPYS